MWWWVVWLYPCPLLQVSTVPKWWHTSWMWLTISRRWPTLCIRHVIFFYLLLLWSATFHPPLTTLWRTSCTTFLWICYLFSIMELNPMSIIWKHMDHTLRQLPPTTFENKLIAWNNEFFFGFKPGMVSLLPFVYCQGFSLPL
jgi:hypothetical protein